MIPSRVRARDGCRNSFKRTYYRTLDAYRRTVKRVLPLNMT